MSEKIRKTSPDRAPHAGSTRDAPTRSCRSGSRALSGGSNGGSGCGPVIEGINTQAPKAMHAGMWKRAKDGISNLPAVEPDKLTFDALFKRYELAQAFSLNSDTVRADAERVKTRLRDGNRLLVDPESKYMQAWDAITIIALLFTLVVSPYEIGYMSELPSDLPIVQTLSATNHIITVTFTMDMLLNFFRPYRDALNNRIKSHRLIAKQYLSSWFVLDVLSTVPFDLLAEAFMPPSDEAGGKSQLTTIKLTRTIRILRLLKLFRIMRASRVFARWSDRLESYLSISYSTRTLLWWTFKLLVCIHWFCCAWGLVATMSASQRDDELMLAFDAHLATGNATADCTGCRSTDHFTEPQCENNCLSPCELEVLSQLNGHSYDFTYRKESLFCRLAAQGQVPVDQTWHFYRYIYVACQFALLEHDVSNNYEYTFFFFINFFWLMMQNAFIGILCGAVADGDRHAKLYKQRMDELNYFLRDTNASADLAARAREHTRSTRTLFKKLAYKKVFDTMSPMLKGDLAQTMSNSTLLNVWYFRGMEEVPQGHEFLRNLSHKITHIGFARGEKIYFVERLNIVARGAAARGGKILTVNYYWGEDMIVTSGALKDTRYSSALTYVELATLTRDDLEQCLVNFPEAERCLRIAALKIAMQRAGQIIAHHVGTRHRARQLASTLSGSKPGGPSVTLQPRGAQERDAAEAMQNIREMLYAVNGGQVLRSYDAKNGKIVDENEQVIDSDFMRNFIKAQANSTDQMVLQVRSEVAALRAEQAETLREVRRLVRAGGGGHAPDRPPSRGAGERVSPSGTETPTGTRFGGHSAGGRAGGGAALARGASSLRQAMKERSATSTSLVGEKGEKRYRRKPKAKPTVEHPGPRYGNGPGGGGGGGGGNRASPTLSC